MKEADFFDWVYWGCGGFLALLTAVLLITVLNGLLRSLWPTQMVVGAPGLVDEMRLNQRQANYHLLLETEENELLALRLRNSGRILRYLNDTPEAQQVAVRHVRGQAMVLTPLNPAGAPIREFPSPWGALLFISGGAAVVLLLAGRPWWRGMKEEVRMKDEG